MATFILNTILILDSLNAKRAIHCSPPVTWNSKVAQSAETWSSFLAKNNYFFHGNSDYGENLAMLRDVTGDDKTYSVIKAIEVWYAEYIYYNYSNPVFSGQTGHFTALVWNSTMEIGVGVSKNSRGYLVVTMRFSPPGNYIGSFDKNVFKKCEIVKKYPPPIRKTPSPKPVKLKKPPPPSPKRKRPITKNP